MILFVALQWLDFVTTILGFSLGASELSPVVRTIMVITGPTLAVLATKILTVFAMWRMSRSSAILRAGNAWYTAIVVWNVLIISSMTTRLH